VRGNDLRFKSEVSKLVLNAQPGGAERGEVPPLCLGPVTGSRPAPGTALEIPAGVLKKKPGRKAGARAAAVSRRQKAEQDILLLNAELERRVAERTRQLEATNKELEAFCYSVSHDLRAPLRTIRGFTELLLQRHAAGLDPKGREFLQRTCEASQHMDKLIDDLLALSRVGRSELRRQRVNLSRLVAAIAEELSQGEPQRQARFIIAPGIEVEGDERLLRIVLDNLLRNAWKFTARQPKPLIEFGVAAEPEQAFFIRDNGAGFDMAYAGRLFGVFQRLHSPAEFPGTGIGLATVQRIVTRHGGRVWAEGRVGAGATFYFTLGLGTNQDG
jgi:light-regulated signal transduction histidine kinase (bacteriophytochrome)